jgi:hypothetical protein
MITSINRGCKARRYLFTYKNNSKKIALCMEDGHLVRFHQVFPLAKG